MAHQANMTGVYQFGVLKLCSNGCFSIAIERTAETLNVKMHRCVQNWAMDRLQHATVLSEVIHSEQHHYG